MRNTTIELTVNIVNEDLTIDSYILNEIKKTIFHDFIDEFEGEVIIRHLEGNKYMIQMHNADIIQTKKKLYTTA